MKEIKIDVAKTWSDEMFRQTVVAYLNGIMAEIGAGIVHENKVAADRAVDQVYDDLPLEVTAAMVESEVAAAVAELNLEELQ